MHLKLYSNMYVIHDMVIFTAAMSTGSDGEEDVTTEAEGGIRVQQSLR